LGVFPKANKFDGIIGVGPIELSRLDMEDAGVGDLEQEKRSRWSVASCDLKPED